MGMMSCRIYLIDLFPFHTLLQWPGCSFTCSGVAPWGATGNLEYKTKVSMEMD